MNTITADIIVKLYTKYQLLNYWQGVGVTLATVFGVLIFIGLIIMCITASCWDNWVPSFVVCMVFFTGLITGLIIYFRYKYQIEVVLKPEIARYVVPAGFDLAEKVGQEVSEMWGILKGVLAK
jgi:hypothetical protein